MLAVISPSKTQDFNPSDVTTFTQTRQMKQSQTLIDILKDKTQDEISSLRKGSNIARIKILGFRR
jgi:cytoplasmic iron level regulating protein YaaA (DUF328/UPF0246 family)